MSSSKLVKIVFGLSLIALIMSALTFTGRFHLDSISVLAGSAEAEKPGAYPANLRAGELTERELTPAEDHAYQVELGTGQYLQILVEQIAVNVSLRLTAPDGRILIQLEGREHEPT